MSSLMMNGVDHRAERGASSSSALVALFVKATVLPVVPLKDEDGEARSAALCVLFSKRGAANTPNAGLRAVLGHPWRA